MRDEMSSHPLKVEIHRAARWQMKQSRKLEDRCVALTENRLRVLGSQNSSPNINSCANEMYLTTVSAAYRCSQQMTDFAEVESEMISKFAGVSEERQYQEIYDTHLDLKEYDVFLVHVSQRSSVPVVTRHEYTLKKKSDDGWEMAEPKVDCFIAPHDTQLNHLTLV